MPFDYNRKSFDFRLVFAILALNVIGVLVIRSASNQNAAMVWRQISGVLIGMTLMLVLAFVPYQKILKYSPGIFLFCAGFLLLVILYGRFVGGAKRWIVVPVVGQVQPSEFSKIGVIVFFAWFLQKNSGQINKPHYLLLTAAIAMLPLGLIASEPDLSTTIVVFVVIASMIYVAGLSYKWILGVLAVIVPLVTGFIYLLSYGMIPFLHEYQARRILAWIDKGKYADLNLQQDNSIMAIGSGQLFGKGLNNNTLASVKNGNFLSEEQTDFIFAVVGEELGFIGCLAVITLYALLVYECLHIAGKARDLEGKLVCTGMGVLVAFQSFCNIAVATGIFPNTGLTLPFISYGVSSLLSLYAGAGLVLNIGLQRTGRLSDQNEYTF
jgi:rod shape determining protein RodA